MQLDVRRGWIAGGLSLLMPGLGHVYAGRPARGAMLWLASVAVTIVSLQLVIRAPSPLTTSLLGLGIMWSIFVPILDSVLVARRAVVPFPLKIYNRWYIYGGAALAFAVLRRPLLLRAAGAVDVFSIASASMGPALLEGDRVLVGPITRSPMRRDILVYQTATEAYRPPHTWGPLVVPANRYFFLGEARDSSLDSRYVGFTPADSIFGQLTQVYFSQDPETHRIRWSRFGFLPR